MQKTELHYCLQFKFAVCIKQLIQNMNNHIYLSSRTSTKLPLALSAVPKILFLSKK